MLIEAAQYFDLSARQSTGEFSREAALTFVRDPQRELSQLRFLSALEVDAQQVRGELAIQLPLLSEVRLPFLSVLQETPAGALLLPQPLSAERAWIEVQGEGQVAQEQLKYAFTFRAHLELPAAEQWGALAFEKMVRAAATRTLARVAQELPQALNAAWEQSL